MVKASVLSILVLAVLVLSAATGLQLTLAEGQDWRSDGAVNWGNIDAYCQRGGKGYLAPSSPFCPEEQVCLYANVTYCGWPEQNRDVAFQMLDPCGRLFVLSGRTNGSGITAVSFRLPSSEYAGWVFGAWRVVAAVSVAEVVVHDTLEFCVTWNLADVNQDGKVDVNDAVVMALAYASTPVDSRWNCNCDVANAYGIIDIYDMMVLAANYGKRCPS